MRATGAAACAAAAAAAAATGCYLLRAYQSQQQDAELGADEARFVCENPQRDITEDDVEMQEETDDMQALLQKVLARNARRGYITEETGAEAEAEAEEEVLDADSDSDWEDVDTDDEEEGLFGGALPPYLAMGGDGEEDEEDEEEEEEEDAEKAIAALMEDPDFLRELIAQQEQHAQAKRGKATVSGAKKSLKKYGAHRR
eukprot:Rhum_TRINITY_DN14558_c13_g1::Rhum_TRINITY_DN14558_c13_g1_i1::g.101683::m.101683